MDVPDYKKELATERLLLRKFKMSDAQFIANLLKEKEVAATTLMLPFPCSVKKAEKMIAEFHEEEQYQKATRWAIVLKETNEVMGGLRLAPNMAFNSAEIGFWLGRPYWRNGYILEAAKKVMEFAFDKMGINRLEAHAMQENLASIELLMKLGFSKEGYHPELVIKWGLYKDVITFGLLRKAYKARSR